METSTASCGVLQTSRNACFARISRYSGRYRPAWREPGWPGAPAQKMNHLFPVLTALAYLLSFGLYVRFLSTGSKLTGRLGTVLLGLGLIAHYFALLERSRGSHTVPYHDLYGSM